jgi:hypothetical protein
MSEAHSPVPLEYRTPADRVDLPLAWTQLSCRVGLVCWLCPLLLGVATFSTWLIFRWDALFGVGWGIIIFGTILALIGAISALVLLSTRWASSRKRFRDAVMPAIILLFLLASNFVVAFVMMLAVFDRSPKFHHGP